MARCDQGFQRRRIHAIVATGAGKSTLMKVLAGVYGESSMASRFVCSRHRRGAPRMVFQETNPVLPMSVAQNIYLGESFHQLRGSISRSAPLRCRSTLC